MATRQKASPLWDSTFPEDSARRRLLQRLLGLGKRPVVVASMSRAGSTLLYKAVVEGWAAERFGSGPTWFGPFISDYAWRLDETPLIGGVVFLFFVLFDSLPRASRPKVLFT